MWNEKLLSPVTYFACLYQWRKLLSVQSGLEVTTTLRNLPHGFEYASCVPCATHRGTRHAHTASDSVVTYHFAVSECLTAHSMHVRTFTSYLSRGMVTSVPSCTVTEPESNEFINAVTHRLKFLMSVISSAFLLSVLYAKWNVCLVDVI